MNIHATIANPITPPPDWVDIDRRRPIEDLVHAESAKAVFDHILASVSSNEVPLLETLIEALDETSIDDGHSIHIKSGIEAVVLNEEIRGALWLALTLKGLPGAAAEAAQAYAKLAYDLADYVWSNAGANSEQRRILRRLVHRSGDAEMSAFGLCLIAAGVDDPSPRIGGTVVTGARELAGHVFSAHRALKRRGL